jgi:hypothetical protein
MAAVLLIGGSGNSVRHNFVNDIGDYAKYALLRALCTNGHTPIRLGVIWYLTDHAERNGDGRKRAHLSQNGWGNLDPNLLTAMRLIEGSLRSQGDLNVRLIEASGILPPDTEYFSEAIPRVQRDVYQRASVRAAWFSRAQKAVAHCNLVFLDPDNGLEVRSAPITSSLGSKYAAVSEIAALLENGAGIVLYQHGSRTPWSTQRERICAQITSATNPALTIRSLRFGAFGARAFFCVTACPYLTEAVETGLDQLRQRVTGWDKSSYLMIE